MMNLLLPLLRRDKLKLTIGKGGKCTSFSRRALALCTNSLHIIPYKGKPLSLSICGRRIRSILRGENAGSKTIFGTIVTLSHMCWTSTDCLGTSAVSSRTRKTRTTLLEGPAEATTTTMTMVTSGGMVAVMMVMMHAQNPVWWLLIFGSLVAVF